MKPLGYDTRLWHSILAGIVKISLNFFKFEKSQYIPSVIIHWHFFKCSQMYHIILSRFLNSLDYLMLWCCFACQYFGIFSVMVNEKDSQIRECFDDFLYWSVVDPLTAWFGKTQISANTGKHWEFFAMVYLVYIVVLFHV